jgi:hypothetical protein
VSFENNMHNLALQLSEAAQKYEEYWQKVEEVAFNYEGLPTWVHSIVGEVTPATAEILGAIQTNKEQYTASIMMARNRCLDIAKAIMRAGGSGGDN